MDLARSVVIKTARKNILNRFLTRCCAEGLYMTRTSPADEIDERYRLNHAIVVKLYHPLYSISRE